MAEGAAVKMRQTFLWKGVGWLREKWDSPNQREIGAFGTVPIFPYVNPRK